MRINYYFCGVKSIVRYMTAALSSVFCISQFIYRYSRRQEWGNSNVPEVFALWNLTTPTVAFLFNVKIHSV